ncbi:prolyl oligopeptidase family serine peptidase [Mucilaginibacter aquatilis]|uniref:Prolyl oligopeptidase family serine peptidase n=1 Tax=Mucilaginibacter aquatilis TaxID=1517760 RepID=A0A6I4IDC9_9SPHI|nr:prolyl oligopeptidase family serine peptidase [Mucilaginibacter aquatilis]MVN92997.1 prolyl oligopeptidase family serine peptidase [Mucilaginibacter aquatilis]
MAISGKMQKVKLRLRRSILVIILLHITSLLCHAQPEFDGIGSTRKFMAHTDAANAMYHYFARQAYGYLNDRSTQISKLSALKDWQARQERMRNKLGKAVGAFPQKQPLKPIITSTIARPGYKVENVVYQSRPGFYVTASIFIPVKGKENEPLPAIVYCSGHIWESYRSAGYQTAILNLVKKGFVVLAYDPLGQGERLGYLDSATQRSRLVSPSNEHSYPGAQLFITGNTLANYFIWDGIRAVDYLLTRKEVDPNRIGITGRSGGGTQSAFIAAFDDRIKAAAPEDYVTSFNWLYQSLGPQDAEQNFMHGISSGIDMADLLAVRSPKPTLVIATSRDMFPIQGTMETVEEVAPLYKLYGKPDQFAMVTDDSGHESTKKNREAMYAFFQKTLNNPGSLTEEEIAYLSPKQLQVTKTGQVATSYKAETVFSLNRKDASVKMKVLNDQRKNSPDYLKSLLPVAKNISGFREPVKISKPVFTGRIQRDGYVIEKFMVKGEGDYDIPYLLFRPDTPGDRALLYLDPKGKAAYGAKSGEVEWFVKRGITVMVPDMLGNGELGPGVFQGDSYIDSVSYNNWFSAMLIGRSITGLHAGDIVTLSRLLKAQIGAKKVFGLAISSLSPALLHAAAFSDDIDRVAMIEPYTSYLSIVEDENYKPSFLHSTVAGSIGQYDLPDLAASLAPKKLLIVNTCGADSKPANAKKIEKEYSVTRKAFSVRNTIDNLIIESGLNINSYSSFEKWIKD